MATVKNKWKIFSVQQCFSTEMTDEQAVEVFNTLLALDDADEFGRYLQNNIHLVIWSPFEGMTFNEFVEHLAALAEHAQIVANTAEA